MPESPDPAPTLADLETAKYDAPSTVPHQPGPVPHPAWAALADAPNPADVELLAVALFDAEQRRLVAEYARLPAIPGRWSDMLTDLRQRYQEDARAALTALAGRLLPADAKTRTEWSVRVTMLDGRTHMALPALAPLMTQHMAEQAAARFAGPGWSNVAKAEPVSRTTSIGPWLPAPTTEES